MTTDSTSARIEAIWRKYDALEQRLSAPLSERMLDLAGLRPGMRVLDIATGRGEPAIPAAKRVFPEGTVVGVDADSSVLKIAQEKALAAGVSNLELIVANVEALDGVPRQFFEVALARWGLMYLQHPVRAIRAIRNALTPGGTLVAAVWIEPAQASFYSLPRAAMSRVADLPPENHDEPSTFYYADLDRLRDDLEAGGFRLKHSEVVQVGVMELTSADELVAWGRAFGRSSLVHELPQDKQVAWERQLISAAEPYRTGEGLIRLGGLSRIIVAEQL